VSASKMAGLYINKLETDGIGPARRSRNPNRIGCLKCKANMSLRLRQGAIVATRHEWYSAREPIALPPIQENSKCDRDTSF
jgi:hypothetical protein